MKGLRPQSKIAKRPRRPKLKIGRGANVAEARKLWGGRFAKATTESVEAFTASIDVDRRLYRHDIAGSIAHAKMLSRQRIIPAGDAQKIVRGLKAIRGEIESGAFTFSAADEDIHMNIERRLTEKIGAAGGKLHTARSRNDQVALDMRLFLRDEVELIIGGLGALERELGRSAKRHIDVIMPGRRRAGPRSCVRAGP